MAERVDAGARVYADALFRAAEEAGRVAEVDRDLRFLTEALVEDRAVLRALLNPSLPAAARGRILGHMGRAAEPLARNALRLLADNGRLGLVVDMQLAFAELAAARERIVDVEITTAVELDDDLAARIERRVSEGTGLTARLERTVDPAIVGGLVLHARGVLVDASIKRQLDEIRRLLARSPLPRGSEA